MRDGRWFSLFEAEAGGASAFQPFSLQPYVPLFWSNSDWDHCEAALRYLAKRSNRRSPNRPASASVSIGLRAQQVGLRTGKTLPVHLQWLYIWLTKSNRGYLHLDTMYIINPGEDLTRIEQTDSNPTTLSTTSLTNHHHALVGLESPPSRAACLFSYTKEVEKSRRLQTLHRDPEPGGDVAELNTVDNVVEKFGDDLPSQVQR